MKFEGLRIFKLLSTLFIMTSIVPWGLLKLRGKTGLWSACSHSHGVERCQSQICQSCQCRTNHGDNETSVTHVSMLVQDNSVSHWVPCTLLMCRAAVVKGHIITEPFCLTSNKVLFVLTNQWMKTEQNKSQNTKLPKGMQQSSGWQLCALYFHHVSSCWGFAYKN